MRLLMNSSHVVLNVLLASLPDAMLLLVPDAQEDNIKMTPDKDPVRPVPLDAGRETKALNQLLIVFLFVGMVLTVQPALFPVLNAHGTASLWSPHKTVSRHVRTAPKECSPSNLAQMTPPNVVRNALLATTATQGWPHVLPVLPTTSNLWPDRDSASNANREKKLRPPELPARMTANLLCAITTCANMGDCASQFITDPNATAPLGLLASTVR